MLNSVSAVIHVGRLPVKLFPQITKALPKRDRTHIATVHEVPPYALHAASGDTIHNAVQRLRELHE